MNAGYQQTRPKDTLRFSRPEQRDEADKRGDADHGLQAPDNPDRSVAAR